jgi:molybdate transport system substrate-binding protein
MPANHVAFLMKIYSTIGVRGPVEALVPRLEKICGCTVDITWGTAPMLVKRIEAGETADVLILSRAGFDSLSKQGKIAPGSDVTLASSGVAIAVKAGAPKPDISTPEALRQTLLNCQCISYSHPDAGGASGVYFAKLLERMGLAETMKPKTKYPPSGGFSASLLVTGEAELAVQQKPELMCVAGTEIVGLLPGDLNVVTVFAAGLASDCTDVPRARALLAALHSAEAKAVFRAKGLDPE